MKKIFIFNLIIFFGCAAISPPPGGPEDKTPPQLLSSIPESGTYNLKGGFNVKLIFSEKHMFPMNHFKMQIQKVQISKMVSPSS